MSTQDVVPDGGKIEHLLWTLMFLKLYSKQASLCSLAGGVDKETYRTWCWRFIEAIVVLEHYVVSTTGRDFTTMTQFVASRLLTYQWPVVCSNRSSGRIDSRKTKGMTVLLPATAQTFGLQNMAGPSTAISSKSQAYGTRSVSVFCWGHGVDQWTL
jgi:hypothetical protein